MIISLEGIEGTGKSTFIKKLKKDLKKYNPTFAKEPGGTAISTKIRELLLDKSNGNMSDKTEALLYAASRHQLLDELLMPIHEQGGLVIMDRYIHSTYAYQVYGRGLDYDFIKTINETEPKWLAKGLSNSPDLSIIIDITVEESQHRLNTRSKKQDRLDLESVEFHSKVRNGYLEIAKNNDNVIIVDGMKPLKQVYKDVLTIIENKLKDEK